MESQKLVKCAGTGSDRKNTTLFAVFVASIFFNILFVCFMTGMPVRGDYRQVYAQANAENVRLAAENDDLRLRLARYEPLDVCVASSLEFVPIRAVPAPVSVIPFDAVDPPSVYFGCLDVVGRMGHFWDGIAPPVARRHMERICQDAAEWSVHHPSERPLIRLF